MAKGRLFIHTRTIYFRMVTFLLIVMCFSCAVTYAITAVAVRYSLEDQIERTFSQSRDLILALSERTGLSPDEIISASGAIGENFSFFKNSEELPQELRRLITSDMRDGEVRISFSFFSPPSAVMRLDGGYMTVSVYDSFSRYLNVKDILLCAFLLCSAIGCVIAVVAVPKATKPVAELGKAFQRLASGELGVKVDYLRNNEVGQLIEHFNEMSDRLSATEQLRQDFISNVSHEFKTPISAIQGSVVMLTKTPFENMTKERFEKYTRIIELETTRMSRLSTNLLRLSHLESGTQQKKDSRFSLDEQLRRTILALEEQWESKGLELDIWLDEIDYFGDEDLLGQVWTNLLSNAIKFSEKGGSIEIKLRRERDSVLVEIADEGVGMSRETLDRLFEKFYQGDRSHASEGNGLGLSIVKKILDLCKARIEVESSPGSGTRITVSLPVRD